jgi:hypothetical protein
VIRERDFDSIAHNGLHNGQHGSSVSRRGANGTSDHEADTSCLGIVLESAPVDSIGRRLLLKRKPE